MCIADLLYELCRSFVQNYTNHHLLIEFCTILNKISTATQWPSTPISVVSHKNLCAFKMATSSSQGGIPIPRANTMGAGLIRTITEGWHRHVEHEDGAYNAHFNEVKKHNKKKIEGDIPAPAGFAKDPMFWKILGIAGIFGIVLGFVAIFFLYFAEKFPTYWVKNSSYESFDDVNFYSGEPYYILITGGTGLIVGVLRYLLHYPETIDGLFKEIGEYHVEPGTAPTTILLSAISLGGGASLGPEQALGTIGGGFATYLTQSYLSGFELVDKQLVVLCGMCAAFGALFPTPVLSVLIIYELGQPPKEFMESVVSMSVAACISFVMFYQYCNYFELEHFTQAGVALSVDWQYSNNQCGMAILIGIVSAGICLLVVIFMGIMRQIFNRIRDKVDMMTPLNGTIVCAVLGGVLVGTISWVLPLTIGDGSLGTSAAIRLTFQESHYSGEPDEPQYMTAQLLLHSAIGKIFTLAVSLNCGFAGGFVFPMLSIGTFAGCVMALYYPSLPVGFCVSCFMAAVPAGICPMPFTLLGIAVYCFYFGIYQTVPIFISIITSYTVICGSGLFGILAHRGNEAAELRKSEMREREANKHQPDHLGEASFPYVAPSPVVVNPMSTSNSLKAPLI